MDSGVSFLCQQCLFSQWGANEGNLHAIRPLRERSRSDLVRHFCPFSLSHDPHENRELADTDKDNMLSALEYLAAKFLIEARLSGEPLPSTLPAGLQPKNTRGSSKRNIAHAREVPAASHQLPISRPQQLSSSASEWSLRSKTRVAYDNLWEKHSRSTSTSSIFHIAIATVFFSLVALLTAKMALSREVLLSRSFLSQGLNGLSSRKFGIFQTEMLITNSIECESLLLLFLFFP